MTTQLAFLRAVNLGKRRVGMARLALLMGELGYDGVATYINSGNVIFDATGPRAKHEAAIEKALEDEFGFEVTTFVRTATELTKVVSAEPFKVAGNDTHFVTFLKAPASAAVTKALEALTDDFDTLVVDGRDVHWRMHGKSTDSHLKSKDWHDAGIELSTSRNMTMLRKLLAKAKPST